MDQFSRRGFLRTTVALGGLSAAGLLTACSPSSGGGSADGGKVVRTQLSWLKTVTFAGFYIAEEQGYFKEEGLSAPLLAGGPNIPDAVSVVTAGGADVALVDFGALIKARESEADLVAIGAVFQESPGGFVSLASNPVRTAKDLVGKRIGLSPGAEVMVEAILKINKLPVRYERVPVGAGTTALTKGDCDVMACYVTAQPLALEQQGVRVVSVTQGQLGMPDYALVMAVKRADLAADRARFVGYLRAVIRGYRHNLKDPALGTKLAVEKYGKDLGLDPAAARRENEVQAALIRGAAGDRGLGSIDPDRLAGPVYAGLRARGVSTLPPVSSVLDTSLAKEALVG
ncbi:ABC transporter substrate-binding protein [Microbispora triticiradicis]|uniref:ABC transporter substrate-binding protein n=1 Tax=Microbispora TaxID=2005 RepID=UPI00142EC3F9|nr:MULTISPECIES: ABC transporter substrate-binding protein [Microbispora]GLW21320.1 myristoyl transferase [Microbispora amethystogenes]